MPIKYPIIMMVEVIASSPVQFLNRNETLINRKIPHINASLDKNKSQRIT
ncbi:MAG: hypothetical protein JSU05_06230 [Bacteroidetes bacterium]|nr:hypothetical protein [Bacteroidota bacterium]